jgi:hypothetical protein
LHIKVLTSKSGGKHLFLNGHTGNIPHFGNTPLKIGVQIKFAEFHVLSLYSFLGKEGSGAPAPYGPP